MSKSSAISPKTVLNSASAPDPEAPALPRRPVPLSAPTDTISEFDPYVEYPLEPDISSHRSVSGHGRESTSNPSESRGEVEQQHMLGDAADGAPTVRFSTYRRFNVLIFMPALMASLMAAGVASVLLGWLLSRRVHSADNGEFRHAFVAAEGGGNESAGIQLFNQLFGADQSNSSDGAGITMFGLAFSSVAVHTVSLTTPFVMSVFAYLLARMWVRDQTSLHSHPT
ncbi:hypothetical protein B0H13DRAFT_2311714 [Mycena leptocephala]|nr:hypothetical protein B0H13DRAFT_2311714 [Mycena leptocephala]